MKTERRRKISLITIQRYFEVLKEIENLTNEKFTYLRLQAFLVERKVEGKTASVLIEKGILKRIKANQKGKRGFSYKWNSIKPSLQMAKAIIEENFQRTKPTTKENNLFSKLPKSKRLEELKEALKPLKEKAPEIQKPFEFKTSDVKFKDETIISKAIRRNTSSVKTEPKEEKEISLLWGLFKFKSKSK